MTQYRPPAEIWTKANRLIAEIAAGRTFTLEEWLHFSRSTSITCPDALKAFQDAQKVVEAAFRDHVRAHNAAGLPPPYPPTSDYVKYSGAMMEAEIKAGRIRSIKPWTDFVSRLRLADSMYEGEGWRLKMVLEIAQFNIERGIETAAHDARQKAREEKLAGRIPLTGSPAGIVFGTLVDGGDDLVIPLRKMQHQLVVGTTGYGKSVYLHGLIQQLLASPEVERVVLIDLKEGGVTFARYRNHPKAMAVWQFSAIQSVVAQVLDLMRQRGEQMSAQGVEVFRGQRVVVIVDEFADIQAEIGMAESKEDKADGRRLIHNLTRISQRARSFGVLLVCAMQRPSADSIDASLRANLPCRICFRVNTSAMAASVLDGLDDAPVRPQHLPRGRYIYYDGGRQKLVQAHVAPGIDLGD